MSAACGQGGWMYLSDVLDHHVRPRETDSLRALLLRADQGARILGALVLAASAAGPEAKRLAAVVLPMVEQATTGTWMYVTRLCMLERARGKGPASAWHVLTTSYGSPRSRYIDRWLSHYEISLRHGGFLPPDDVSASLQASIACGLDQICDDIVRLDNPRLSGEGALTCAWGRGTAPYFEVSGEAVYVLERVEKKRTKWRTLPGGAYHRDLRSRSRVGVWSALNAHISTDPLGALTGPVTEPRLELPLDRRVGVVSVDGDLVVAAQDHAQRLRTPTRPVLVVPGSPHSVSLSKLVMQVLPAKSEKRLLELLENWVGQRPVVVLFGPLDGDGLVQLGAQANELVHLVAVVPTWMPRRWRPASRHRLQMLGSDVVADLPECVRQVDAPDEVTRWRVAATTVLGLGTEAGRRAVARLLDGTCRPLEASDGVVLGWWQDGLLSVDAAGRPSFDHPGWSALAAGLLGRPEPMGVPEAWAAGQILRGESLDTGGPA